MKQYSAVLEQTINKLIEPEKQIPEDRKSFTNRALPTLITPIIVEQFLTLLVGIVDTMMVSYAGEAAVSAGQLFMIISVISIVIATLVLMLAGPIFSGLFGRVEADVKVAGLQYLFITAWSFPFLAVYNSCGGLFRSMGKTKELMYVSIVMNGINIIGNTIGIFVLHAGVAGVAYPTLISRVFAAVAMCILSVNHKNTIYLRARDIFTWNGDMLKRIFYVAVPNSIDN